MHGRRRGRGWGCLVRRHSLRHRREGCHGYRLRGEVDVRDASAAYDELIDAGIEIYEYCPTMLHAKTLTVHDEVTLCVQGGRFAGQLHEVFERDLEDSERIEPDEWRERPMTQRARENVTKYARREL
jgi:cardiolipin synthase A/B